MVGRILVDVENVFQKDGVYVEQCLHYHSISRTSTGSARSPTESLLLMKPCTNHRTHASINKAL